MFETLNADLSDYLKLLRFKKKKSQEEVAKELNITRNTYTNWENNPVSLSLDTLNKLVRFYGENILIFFQQYVAKSNKNKEEK